MYPWTWPKTGSPLPSHTRAGVLELKVLIREAGAIDGLPTVAITARKVASLNHEILDDPVELGAFVAKALFSCCQGPEIFNSL